MEDKAHNITGIHKVVEPRKLILLKMAAIKMTRVFQIMQRYFNFTQQVNKSQTGMYKGYFF